MVFFTGGDFRGGFREISAGQKLRKVMSANNERESFVDYELDYTSLGRRGRALIPPITKSFCPKVKRVSLIKKH